MTYTNDVKEDSLIASEAQQSRLDIGAGLASEGTQLARLIAVTSAKCRAYLGTNQIVASGSFVKINLGSEDYDVGNDFDSTTNYQFDIPIAGYYLVTVSAREDAPADGNTVELSIFKNAAAISNTAHVVGAANIAHPTFADIIRLKRGDYIDMRLKHNAGVDKTVLAGSDVTFMAVHILSTDRV